MALILVRSVSLAFILLQAGFHWGLRLGSMKVPGNVFFDLPSTVRLGLAPVFGRYARSNAVVSTEVCLRVHRPM
ncbi:hypothetical protein PLICRDRAFT_325084 [Plicaturopsis crispa FD-325 SS-3]|nr:hypothetical protein PLICRDRAFT_325084 [Plicaturopsis crispa FD-325 SS-3]